MLNLDAIKERRAAIGEVDWSAHAATFPNEHVALFYDSLRCPAILHGEKRWETGTFVAHAPADITALVAEVERLRVDRDSWKKVATQVGKYLQEAEDEADRWKCHAAAQAGMLPNPNPARLVREAQRGGDHA